MIQNPETNPKTKPDGVVITPEEAFVLATALQVNASALVEAAFELPTLASDPNTQRYVLKDQAHDLEVRARELRNEACEIQELRR